jgi:hypothetical protein
MCFLLICILDKLLLSSSHQCLATMSIVRVMTRMDRLLGASQPQASLLPLKHMTVLTAKINSDLKEQVGESGSGKYCCFGAVPKLW